MRKTFLFILALCAASAVWGASVTVSKTAKEIGTAAKWSKSTAYATAKLDDVITITVTPGTGDNKNGVYYTGDYTDTHDWRMYQARAEGQFAITAAEGYVITSVTLTYEVTNTGVVSTAVKESGVATPAAKQILSGTPYPFAARELTFYVGNTTAATTNGQARIRKFSVTYEKGIYDDFRDPTTGELLNYTSATEKSVTTQCFTWTAHNCRFNTDAMDILADKTPSNTMWKNNGSYLQTKAVEGGVKTIYFPWNQAKADESKKGTETVKVTVDTKNQSQSREGKAADSRGADSKFSFACNVKKNADVKIEIAAGNRITVGPITIVPYLRYTYTEMQEVKIGDGTFDCSLQIDNTDNEGTITYGSDNPEVVSFVSATNPEATLVGGGEATITATWSEGASTSFKLKVIAKSTPEISFAQSAITITDLYTTDPVANELTVTEGADEVIYTSSNPLVAQIVENQVMVVGVGTATITATAAENEDYVSASASYALTVNEPEDETAVKENFKGKLAKQDTYADTEASFTDQLGLYSWKANGYRYNETWVRLKTTEAPYLKFDGNQEGGIKRLVFKWFRAGGETALPIKTSIKVMDGETMLAEGSIDLEAKVAHGSLQPYNVKMEVKQNAQLVIDNTSADGAVMHFQDIKIVPYVLYTEKAQTANAENGTYDATTGLINNAPKGEVAFSIVADGAQSEINETTGVIDMSKVTISEDIVIKATYEDAYTTMNLHVNALPIPVVTFPNLTGNTKTVNMDQVPFTESISVKVGEVDYTSSATITYTSDNEEVAIIKDNKVSIIGVGTATITAKIAPKTGIYAGRDVYYTLTVEDNTPAGKQWTETFSSIGNVTEYITKRNPDIVGDSSIYSWAMRNYRRRQTQADSLATEQAIRLSNANNNYIETLNNQEGGIKRISFNWRTPGTEAGQLPINLNVSVCYNNYQDTVKRPMTRAKSKDNMTDNLYCSNFFVKQNAKLKIDIADETYSVMLIGPITITPYLLYTKKVVEVTYDLEGENTVDATANLINNIDEGTVTYSLSEGAQATIDGSTITLANATEDVIVTATWGEVSTTYTLKVTKAAEPALTRDDLHEGQLITVCLDKNITSAIGGTFYQIEQGTTSEITFAEFAEDEFPIAKATPLLFQSDGTTMKVYCGTDKVADDKIKDIVEHRAMKGLVQTATDKPSIDPGNILVNNGQLRLVGANCVLTPGHAYIDVEELVKLGSLQQTPSGAPRRTIRLYNPDAAPTNLNGLNGAVKPMKVLRDGQLYIIRETKTYNAQGIEVQ